MRHYFANQQKITPSEKCQDVKPNRKTVFGAEWQCCKLAQNPKV